MSKTSKERIDDVPEEEECPGAGLGDLPQRCIAAILGFTAPKDIARLSCTSRVFWDASFSDVLWESKLPPHYADILEEASNVPPNMSLKKEVYDYLSTRALLLNETEDYWLDRATGGVCRSISARALNVAWGTDERYWLWCPEEDTRFSEVAYLEQVCWLDVQGQLKSSLPPGTYTLSWRLRMGGKALHPPMSGMRWGPITAFGWADRPVKFSFETIENQQVEKELYLTKPPLKYGKWIEIDVGEFIVEEGEDLPVEIHFSMMDTEGGRWKGGLFLDCVVIRPSFIKLESYVDEPDGRNVSSSLQDENLAEGVDIDCCDMRIEEDTTENVFRDDDSVEDAGGLCLSTEEIEMYRRINIPPT